MRHRLSSRFLAATAFACLGVVGWTASAAIPTAEAGFKLGVGGPDFFSPDRATRALWLDRTATSGSKLVRVSASWRGIAHRRPADPANPADPAYDFDALDAVVREIAAHRLRPLVTVNNAPDFAEAPGRPAPARPGTWQPDPAAVGAFGRALAARYSGAFAGLPRVRYFQLWNEPNLSAYLAPQYSGRKAVGALHYRRMLNAFYAGVKSVRKGDLVITGGTAPYGDAPGGARTRPLAFWRKVLCLRRSGHRLAPTRCEPKPRFDALAHHAINTSGGPRRNAIHRDDASTADLDEVVETLRAAERGRRIAGTRKRHHLWVTEMWWESNPPDSFRGLPLQRHARYIEETLYLAWKAGAKAVVNLFIHDQPYDPSQPLATTEAGLYFADGRPKPALQAWRFPFVTERRSRRVVRAWGKAPAGGRLVVERRRGSRWLRIGSKRVRRGGVFTLNLPLRGKAELQARVGGEKSIVWQQRR